MARKPLYNCDKGLARTTVNGKRVYLGKYDSPESREKYQKIIAEWEAAHAERDKSAQVTITVSRLAVLFLKHAEKEYVRDGEPTGETNNFRQALRALTNLYHGVKVIDFGPKKLKALQQKMVDQGYAQQTINAALRRIKQVFDWGVSEEIVPGRIAQDLHTVAGLRAGRTAAPAPKSKGSVALADIQAIKPFVTKPVWAMIQFMLFTGCRPSECCRMKWAEIDTTQEVWTYCPHHHKTAHRGKKRVILIGPQAQQVLNSLRELSRSDFLFDPQAGLEEFLRKAYGENAKVRATIGDCYSKHSLNAAVRKACEKAIEKKLITASWSPGQLRKTRATQARQQGDLETAQQVLGHSSKQTTERHYAEVDLSRAAANALQFG